MNEESERIKKKDEEGKKRGRKIVAMKRQ